MLGFIEFGLSEILGAFALVAILATLIAHFKFGVFTAKKASDAEAIRLLESVVNAQGEKISLLDEGLKGCKAEHANCEMRVNQITAFNLRLQAREQAYQKTINRLELKLGLEITDFNDVSHAPEGPDFR